MSETVPSGSSAGRFHGWRVVVMGGSRGIGRAVAAGFADCGAHISVCGRDRSSLDRVCADLVTRGVVAHAAPCDVGDVAAVAAFVTAAAQTLGGIDVLVNCASAFAMTDDEAGWSASFAIDLMGSVRAGHAALPFLRNSAHASIVNVSSVAALQATYRRPAYGAMKAAIINQTASNARLLAADGIRVNCVVPGSTDFPGGVWERISQTNPSLYASTRDGIPLGRFGTPEDIARVVLFLASPGGWITGQSIVVDGGQSLTGF